MPWIYCYQCCGYYPIDEEFVPIYKVGRTENKDPNNRKHQGLNKYTIDHIKVDICVKVNKDKKIEKKLKATMKADDKFTFLDDIGDEYFTTTDIIYLIKRLHILIAEYIIEYDLNLDAGGNISNIENIDNTSDKIFKYSLANTNYTTNGAVKDLINDFIKRLFGENHLNYNNEKVRSELLNKCGNKFKQNESDSNNYIYKLSELDLYMNINLSRERGLKICKAISESFNISFISHSF